MIRKIVRARKHRLPRKCYQGEIWGSFTLSVENKQPLFTDHKIVDKFVSFLDISRKRNECIVLLYTFMPDHIHMVLQGQSDQVDLWKGIVDFKQKAGFYFQKSQIPYPLQKDFYDHIIRKEDDLVLQIRYIAENPVRRGLVNHWQDYPFTGSLGIEMEVVRTTLLILD